MPWAVPSSSCHGRRSRPPIHRRSRVPRRRLARPESRRGYDDTELTLALARALTERGLELDLFAAELLAWYRSDPKDIGTTTRRALAALAGGTGPDGSGEAALVGLAEGKGASNGAVMRCAPVALRFRKDRRRLAEASLASARATHAEPRAAGQPSPSTTGSSTS
jgi:ADP-ribosylglycohydrolase